ncbi:major tail protein [Romboutsia hominis]|uniref:major tail protein n=1 Tax=Romboutsia hominis TaxID=1507512 RepID=UPI000A5D2422|nr:major tail protein [Romboutsia hominis]
MAAQQRILPVVNVSKLYVAHLLTETDGSITFDIPRYLEGVKQIGIKPKQNSDPYYHEGKKVLEEQTLQDVKVTLNITDLKDIDECYVMGHKLAKTGGVIKNDNDIAPTLAILYKSEKSQGIDKYGILYAGTFGLSDEDLKSKEGKANFQAKKIEASFRPLINGLWQYNVCSDSPNATEEFLKNFFKQVTIPEEKVDEISEH